MSINTIKYNLLIFIVIIFACHRNAKTIGMSPQIQKISAGLGYTSKNKILKYIKYKHSATAIKIIPIVNRPIILPFVDLKERDFVANPTPITPKIAVAIQWIDA